MTRLSRLHEQRPRGTWLEFDRMIHTLRAISASCGRRAFPSRFVSLADANETLAAQRDHALTLASQRPPQAWIEAKRFGVLDQRLGGLGMAGVQQDIPGMWDQHGRDP
jgi:hypothetical protein